MSIPGVQQFPWKSSNFLISNSEISMIKILKIELNEY
jgi:hypothetical protein